MGPMELAVLVKDAIVKVTGVKVLGHMGMFALGARSLYIVLNDPPDESMVALAKRGVEEVNRSLPSRYTAQLVIGTHQPINDRATKEVLSTLVSFLERELGSLDESMRETNTGMLFVSSETPSEETIQGAVEILQAAGCDGKFHRYLLMMGDTPLVVEVNATPPTDVLPSWQDSPELMDPVRLRRDPITDDALTDLKILLGVTKSVEEFLSRCDEVGSHG